MKHTKIHLFYIVFVSLLTMGVTQAEVIKFKLADVKVAEKLLPEVEYRQAIEKRIGSPVESYSQVNKKLVSSHLHPFVQAVFDAFREHRPLAISPDMVWLLITQGFAEHVNNNAELLRKKFVTYQGKKLINVRRDDFIKGELNNPWEEVFPEFAKAIKADVGAELHQLVIASFSTTGNIEKAAFEITLMDAMKNYFSYKSITYCGIPFITLEGTPEDWRLIVSKAKQLRQYELDWWIDELIPILEQFSAAAQGKVDETFWNGMFKYIPPKGNSGGIPYINGWIIKFFPYLTTLHYTHGTTVQDEIRRNPFLSQTSVKLTGFDFEDFSGGLSKANFQWDYLGQIYKMDFFAGFVGVSQDAKTKTLRPEIGWAVLDSTTAEVTH